LRTWATASSRTQKATRPFPSRPACKVCQPALGLLHCCCCCCDGALTVRFCQQWHGAGATSARLGSPSACFLWLVLWAAWASAR
jgi:hypothetical protein